MDNNVKNTNLDGLDELRRRLKAREAAREAAPQVYGGDAAADGAVPSYACARCGAPVPAGAKTCGSCGAPQGDRKFCQHCGAVIDGDCVVCPACGKQVGQVRSDAPQVVINNSNRSSNVNTNTNVAANVRTGHGHGRGRRKNKWVAFWLCLLLGVVGAHKFYEGDIKMGILYMLTGGLLLFGYVRDLFAILGKPNPYYI